MMLFGEDYLPNFMSEEPTPLEKFGESIDNLRAKADASAREIFQGFVDLSRESSELELANQAHISLLNQEISALKKKLGEIKCSFERVKKENDSYKEMFDSIDDMVTKKKRKLTLVPASSMPSTSTVMSSVVGQQVVPKIEPVVTLESVW